MPNNNVLLSFYGGVGTVTGANFGLSYQDRHMLVDCGMLQGSDEADAYNRAEFAFDPKTIDVVMITHAHMDHIGRLPKLVRDGFRGDIYSTEPTKALAAIMLEDGARIVATESERAGLEPWYTQDDVDHMLSRWKTMPYHGTSTVAEHFSVALYDTGHVLGSAMVHVEVGEKKVLFTGDIGNSPMPLLRDVEQAPASDYVVMESVYGDREHEHTDDRTARLERIIETTIARKGTLIIPIFSMERTQEILFELNNLVEGGRVPEVPVFLDSPLAIKVTEVYQQYKNYFNTQARKQAETDNLFDFPRLKYTDTKEQSKAINRVYGPKIIMAGSGMSHAGRVIHHERRYLSDKKNTILFVGYQGVGTMGRLLQSKPRTIKIFGDDVKVRAQIESIKGYSGHAGLSGLTSFVEPLAGTVKKVFCTMGEPKSSRFLAQRLREYYAIPTEVPEQNDVVVLE